MSRRRLYGAEVSFWRRSSAASLLIISSALPRTIMTGTLIFVGSKSERPAWISCQSMYGPLGSWIDSGLLCFAVESEAKRASIQASITRSEEHTSELQSRLHLV